jgi:hypothetical protein
MNKRGQFFLIAAIIIIGLIIGFATAVNSVRVGDRNEAFYDLADEVGFETKKVLDYGVYQIANTETLMKGFLENYTDYIATEEVLFIFGNEDSLDVLYFENLVIGSVGISVGPAPTIVPIQDYVDQTETAEVIHDLSDNKVTVKIKEINYEFKLRKGQNFFFIIIKDQDDERFVAKG